MLKLVTTAAIAPGGSTAVSRRLSANIAIATSTRTTSAASTNLRLIMAGSPGDSIRGEQIEEARALI